GVKYFPAIQTVSVFPETNSVCSVHHRAGAFTHVGIAATTHPGWPPPTHPADVSTFNGSNIATHAMVSCMLRPHERTSFVPCTPTTPEENFVASNGCASLAVNCASSVNRSFPCDPGVRFLHGIERFPGWLFVTTVHSASTRLAGDSLSSAAQ